MNNKHLKPEGNNPLSNQKIDPHNMKNKIISWLQMVGNDDEVKKFIKEIEGLIDERHKSLYFKTCQKYLHSIIERLANPKHYTE